MNTEYKQMMEAAQKRRKEIAKLVRKGVSQAEIARRVGISKQRAHVIVKSIQEEASK